MSIISFVVFSIFIVFAFANIHKCILVYAPLSILFQLYLCLRYDSPAIALNTSVEVIILMIYFIKERVHFRSFPLYKVYILLFSVLIFSAIISPLGILSTGPAVLATIFSYLIALLFYNEVKTENDYRIAIRSFFLSFFVLAIYGLFELITQSNPIMSYLFSIFPEEKGWVYYSEETRFSSIRCQSLLPICISWGAYCCLVLSVLIYLKKDGFIRMNITSSFAASLLLIAFIVFSGTRSAYLFLFVIIAGYVLSAQKASKFFAMLIVVAVLFIFRDSFLSIISDAQSVDSGFSGSSVEQRQLQFVAAMRVITRSPIWGLGYRGLSAAQDMDTDVLGAESIWLQQLINSGFIGVITQIIVYVSVIVYIVKLSSVKNKKFAFFFVLGWIVFCTFTSSPGLREPYFFVILFLITKERLLIKE